MGRVKHAMTLVFKLFFIVFCFMLAASYTALKNMDTTTLDGMKGKLGVDSCEIMVMDATFEMIGASLKYEIKDSKIVFDLVQSGDKYDDVCVFINYPAFDYDTSEMKKYLQETIGDRAKKEEDYLDAMEEGPWNCNYNFVLSGNVDSENSNNVIYTIVDPDFEEHTGVCKAEDGDEKERIEEIYVGKGDEPSFMLIFGSEKNGALPSGQYVFEADLGVSGLYNEDVELSIVSKIGIIVGTCANAIKEEGFGIFDIENWLVFYGAMIVGGMFIYLWNDLRSMKKIFCAMEEERHPPVRVIIKVFVNGYCTEEYSYIDYGTDMIASLLVTIMCYFIFLITIPIRIVIHLIRDIFYLFAEDDEIEGFSIIGSILGSVGIYVLMFGIVGFIGVSIVTGVICSVVGLGMCIGAHFICRYCEEEFG